MSFLEKHVELEVSMLSGKSQTPNPQTQFLSYLESRKKDDLKAEKKLSEKKMETRRQARRVMTG